MIALHRAIAPLALICALAGCSTTADHSAPPPPAMTEAGEPPENSPAPAKAYYLRLQQAITAANQGRYPFAASELQSLLASDDLSLPLRREALANQALLYLRSDTPLHNPKSASLAVDTLYQLALQHPEQQDTLLRALDLALENTLRLNKLESQHRDALEQQQQLRQNVAALEEALEKLRQLSLQ